MNTRILLIISMGILSFLFGCNNKNSNSSKTFIYDNVELEEITSRIDQGEGWFDIFLKIVSETKTDTSHIYIAKGKYQEKIVGLQVEVNSTIGAGIVKQKMNNSGFKFHGVTLQSVTI